MTGLVTENKDQYKDQKGTLGKWLLIVGLDRRRKFIDPLRQ